jgi:hypothetical protein
VPKHWANYLAAGVFLATGWLGAGLVGWSPIVQAQTGWPDEQRAGPFLCHADFPLAEQKPLLAELAVVEDDLRKTLGTPAVSEPIHLFLFQSKQSYQGYMQQYFPRVPYRRALYIKARGPGMVFAFRGDEFAVDVRHETTHALLHAWLRDVPLWLDEGLAEYFEVPHDQRAGHNPHLATTRALIGTGEHPRLEELEELLSIDNMGRDEYRDAWAWVHFMLHGPTEANEELLSYLGELKEGIPAEPLSRRLRRRLPDLNRRVVDHFR